MKRTCLVAALFLCCGSAPADAGLFGSFGRHRGGCHDGCTPSCAAPAICCEEPTCYAPPGCLTHGYGPAQPTCCAPSAPSCCAPSAPSCCMPSAPSCCAPTRPGRYAPVGSDQVGPAPVISPYQGSSAPVIYGPPGGSAPVPYSITPLAPATRPQAAPSEVAPVLPKADPAPPKADPAPAPAEEPFEDEVMDTPSAGNAGPAGGAEAYFPTRAGAGPFGLAN